MSEKFILKQLSQLNAIKELHCQMNAHRFMQYQKAQYKANLNLISQYGIPI